MPIIEVRHIRGGLDAATKADLARRLTRVLIQMEGGADTHGGRAFAWVCFTEFAKEDWWVGGGTGEEYVAPPGRFLVSIRIPEGYMNTAHKQEVHAWVAEAIVQATGASPPGASILTVIDEVAEGNWGAGGQAISLERIAVAVGQPAEGERLAWSRRYFEAKARALAAAGYPADLGGLPPSLARGITSPP